MGDFENCRDEANRRELLQRIGRAIEGDGSREAISGVHLYRSSRPTEPVIGVSKPAFCVIAQGSKEILLGDKTYRYDPGHYLLATVELPAAGQVHEATPERPYLGLDSTSIRFSSVR